MDWQNKRQAPQTHTPPPIQQQETLENSIKTSDHHTPTCTTYTTDTQPANKTTRYNSVQVHTAVPSETDMKKSHGICCIQVDHTQLERALASLWTAPGQDDDGRAARFIEFAALANMDLDQCWAIQRPNSDLNPVCLAVPNAGRTATLIASNPRRDRERRDLTQLLAYVRTHLDSSRVALGQVILTRTERQLRRAYLEAGFTYLADLGYLERKSKPSDSACDANWPDGCTVESLDVNTNWTDFRHAMLESYKNTLDCPMLCSLRTVDDIMAGHREAGVFTPNLWTLIRMDGKPAAVLILNPFEDQGLVELTYIGVGAQFRRNGLAKSLMNLAFRQTHARGAEKITLAVDESNVPAIQMYREIGFRRVDRRIALVCKTEQQ